MGNPEDKSDDLDLDNPNMLKIYRKNTGLPDDATKEDVMRFYIKTLKLPEDATFEDVMFAQIRFRYKEKLGLSEESNVCTGPIDMLLTILGNDDPETQ